MKETVPVAVHYRVDLHPHPPGPGEEHVYTVAMFIPYEHQAGHLCHTFFL